MHRSIHQALLAWKDAPGRLPLILRGARQVGKTFAVTQFAKEHFQTCFTINFELDSQYLACFDTLRPQTILFQMNLLSHQDIIPGQTLLFLDEIQECPNALRALRYFKEELPELHVIAAGSLLEFLLNAGEFRFPVGRVQFLQVHPLSFYEFLWAKEDNKILEFLKNVGVQDSIPSAIHEHLLKQVREYMILGGMPAVVQHYLETGNVLACQDKQAGLWQAYRYDFGKYAKQGQHRFLETIFTQMPSLIGQNVKYSAIDPQSRARDLKEALALLYSAGIIHFVRETSASGVPLSVQSQHKRFKLLFLDIGLIHRNFNINPEQLLKDDLLLINRGVLAEQFVGQELIAYSHPMEESSLYYWQRDKPSSTAEVDYVLEFAGNCVAVEVKAGKTGRLRSLQLFMTEKKSSIGIQISAQNLMVKDSILSLPLYLIAEWPRLLTELLG